MFGRLLGVYLQTLLHSMFVFSGKKRRHPLLMKALAGLLGLYLVAALLVSMSLLFTLGAESFLGKGNDRVYWYFAGLVALGVSLFGSVFITQSVLYEAKDNDFLLSLPLPFRAILGVRLFVLYLLNFFCCGGVLLPALFVFRLYAYGGILPFLCAGVACLLFPLVSLCVCCVLGWLLARFTAGKKRKNTVQTVILLTAMVGYVGAVLNMQALFGHIAAGSESILNLARHMPHIYLFGNAGAGSGSALMWFALSAVLPTVLICGVLAKTFFSVVGKKGGAAQTAYSEKSIRTSGKKIALLRKELGKFFSSPNYLLNCGFGGIMAILFGATIGLKGNMFFASLPLKGDGLCVPVGGFILFCVATVNTTAVSLSLEGKCLYYLHAMPLSPREILGAKLTLNLLLSIPAGFGGVILGCAGFSLSPLCRVLTLCLPLCGAFFTSVAGQGFNLKYLNLNWTNETVVIKQSASILLSMVTAMGSSVLAVAPYVGLNTVYAVPPAPWLGGVCAAFLGAGALIYRRNLRRCESILLQG